MNIMDSLHAMTSLVRTSVEEAARFGRPAADVDHLLLALTLTDTPAGQLLRTQGAKYDATLAAMRDAERDALESIGITAPTTLRPADPTTTNGLTDRASRIFRKAAKVEPDYLAFLDVLLAEPSGTVATILGRLGTSVEQVRGGIASAAQEHDERRAKGRASGADDGTNDTAGRNDRAGQYADVDESHGTRHINVDAEIASASPVLGARATTSCPARFDVVAEYLRNPDNAVVWEPAFHGRVLIATGADSWAAPRAEGTAKAKGWPMRVIRETVSDERISWRFEPINAPRVNITRVTFTLTPDGEATTVRTDLRFTPTTRHSLLRRLLWRPIARPLARLHAESISGAVSKAFRP